MVAAGAEKVDCMLCGAGYDWTLVGVAEELVDAGLGPALVGRTMSVTQDEQSLWTAVLRSQWSPGQWTS